VTTRLPGCGEVTLDDWHCLIFFKYNTNKVAKIQEAEPISNTW
jgi:hypothetical protein